MLPKKFRIKNLWYLALTWVLLLMCFGLVIGFVTIGFMETANNRPIRHIAPTTIICLVLYLLTEWFWRKATFRRTDFIALGEQIGVKFNRKRFYYPPLGFIETYRCADGFLDDIYIVARIDFPFWAFSTGWDFPSNKDDVEIPRSKSRNYWIRTRNYSIPYFMKEEARIELFSLISGPLDIDVTIKIEEGKRNIPTTGSAAVDEILGYDLRDVEYFHARLMINKACLRMTLIGGSWEGRRFGEKILKGFEIFQALNSELKGKYQVGTWNDWQVKWNRKEEEFFLEAKGGVR